jgi:hypothetical protein
MLEPVLEFRVVVGILVNLVDGINQVVRGSAVGKSLEQSLDIGQPMNIFRVKSYTNAPSGQLQRVEEHRHDAHLSRFLWPAGSRS